MIDKLKPTQIYTSGSGLLELVFNALDMESEDEGFFGKIKRLFGR